MCGLSVIIDSSSKLDLPRSIHAMNKLIAHRGPDDEGYVLFDSKNKAMQICRGDDTISFVDARHILNSEVNQANIAFGHRRLAIVDVSAAGHQPFFDVSGRYSIVYNGEIYNYLELRSELERLGCNFQTHTDTEVLLNAYMLWGEACLDHFNGMFAFVIYDRELGRFFVARDRFGIKPLYYWYSPAGFLAFASEIKQFTVLPGWQPALNYQHAYDFLAWGLADYDAETMFSNVYQLPVGSCASFVVGGSFKSEQWYHLSSTASKVSSYEEACEEVSRLLRQSVKMRLRADVKVGTGLSGGLDSSAIVCIIDDLLDAAKKNEGGLQHAFSAYCDVKSLDERDYIHAVTEHVKLKHFAVTPSLDRFYENFSNLVWHQDEPFSGASIFAEYSVYKLVHDSGVNVTLDGHGADELFGGYHTFFPILLRDMAKRANFTGLFKEWSAIKQLHGHRAGLLLRAVGKLLPTNVASFLHAALSQGFDKKSNWLDQAAFKQIDLGRRYRFESSNMSLADFSQSQLLQASTPFQLHWADRNAMTHSVENRVPYLDHHLVEFVLGLPNQFKISRGITKKILRDAVRNLLPREVVDRVSKLGYVAPEKYWFTQQDPSHFLQLLKQAVSQLDGIIKPDLLMQCQGSKNSISVYDPCLWRVISFAAWMGRFGVKK